MRNGLLLIDKPEGMTSRDVVNKLNKVLDTKKIGHTGTLDPLATGLLVVCIGRATKLVDVLTANKKTYIATMKLGIKTDTADITGNVIDTKPFQITEADIQSIFHSLLGTHLQEVPIYSAVKINGKKLYEYAREGKEVELPKREVTIHQLNCISFQDDTITFEAEVSKGTYIRALIEEIAEKLHTVATMTSLKRTKQGNFSIEDACPLEEVTSSTNLLTIKEALQEFKQEQIPEEYRTLILNGGKIPIVLKEKTMYLNQEIPIAIYEAKSDVESGPYKML